MNTRMYPRTMREAFKDADYSCAVERPLPFLRKLDILMEATKDAAFWIGISAGAFTALLVIAGVL